MNELMIFGIFILITIVFMVINRKNIELKPMLRIPIPFTKHKLPVIYMVLWHTQLDLEWLKQVALSHKKLITWVGNFTIILAVLAVIITTFALIKNITDILLIPETVSTAAVMLVLPFKTQSHLYVPILFWLISIFVIALVHEGGHAMLAMAHGIPIRSAGLAFFCLGIPVIPAAFVEPNQSVVLTKTKKQQLSFFAAGSGFNMLIGLLFLGIFLFVRGFEILWVSQLLFWLTILNLGVGMFNVLPIVPLDGGHMVRTMIKGKNKQGWVVGIFSTLFIMLLICPYFLR